MFRSAPLLKRSPFLLTPLREGRRKQDLHRVVRVRISTHAPAGGATRGPCAGIQPRNISTHAPAGGATAVGPNPKKQMLLFLLTPLREGRPAKPGYGVQGHHISTHAPAGGATCWNGRGASTLGISTHAPAGGAT